MNIRFPALVIAFWFSVVPARPGSEELEVMLRKDWHGGVRALFPVAEDTSRSSADSLSAAFVMDKGEHALRIRAWLVQNAKTRLDVQYFIWSTDNVGQLALEALRQAAERGVQVRILVDDLMLEKPYDLLLAMNAHPSVEIRIYNPNYTMGVGLARRLGTALTDFRGLNQRMHQKTLVVDGLAAIVGGRNMADEYYDFDPEFNFRDRDLLVAGPVVPEISAAFEDHWQSPLSRPVSEVLPKEVAALDSAGVQRIWSRLQERWIDTVNFAPAMRAGIDSVPARAADLLQDLDLCKARYVYDDPGKNDGTQGLGGGGKATAALAEFLRSAQREVLIQTPYLILDKEALALFRELRSRGVRVRISTNSAANSDNHYAVSGYQKQRKRLLEAGLEIYELKPYPENMRKLIPRHGAFSEKMPVFVLHAKTAVVDGQKLFVGTYNLDPRSQNLNTEAGVILESPKLAAEAAAAIEEDILPANSWTAQSGEGDRAVSRGQRFKLWMWRRLPLDAVL